MGLDIVEFIMAVEEKFGIEIPDAAAAKLTTPRKLVDFIMTRIEPSEDRGCLTQRGFYRMRRALINRHWATRQSLKPETPLERIVPKPNRRTAWQQLGEELQAREWPMLVRSGAIAKSLASLTFLAFVLPWFFVCQDLLRGNHGPLALCAISPAIVALIGVAATRPLRTAFPSHCLSVGDASRNMVTVSGKNHSAEEGWTREQVGLTVRKLVTEQFGVEDFSDDSHFVEDLGVD